MQDLIIGNEICLYHLIVNLNQILQILNFVGDNFIYECDSYINANGR